MFQTFNALIYAWVKKVFVDWIVWNRMQIEMNFFFIYFFYLQLTKYALCELKNRKHQYSIFLKQIQA